MALKITDQRINCPGLKITDQCINCRGSPFMGLSNLGAIEWH